MGGSNIKKILLFITDLIRIFLSLFFILGTIVYISLKIYVAALICLFLLIICVYKNNLLINIFRKLKKINLEVSLEPKEENIKIPKKEEKKEIREVFKENIEISNEKKENNKEAFTFQINDENLFFLEEFLGTKKEFQLKYMQKKSYEDITVLLLDREKKGELFYYKCYDTNNKIEIILAEHRMLCGVL